MAGQKRHRRLWSGDLELSPQMNMKLAQINWTEPSDGFFLDDEGVPSLSDYIDGLGVE